MAYLNEMTNNIRIADSFGAATNSASLFSTASNGFSPLLFDSGRLQISGDNRKRVRFNPNSVAAKPGTLGSLTISELGHWDYAVYNIKTQHLAVGEKAFETFYLRSTEGERFLMTIVLVGARNGAVIEELETNVGFA